MVRNLEEFKKELDSLLAQYALKVEKLDKAQEKRGGFVDSYLIKSPNKKTLAFDVLISRDDITLCSENALSLEFVLKSDTKKDCKTFEKVLRLVSDILKGGMSVNVYVNANGEIVATRVKNGTNNFYRASFFGLFGKKQRKTLNYEAYELKDGWQRE